MNIIDRFSGVPELVSQLEGCISPEDSIVLPFCPFEEWEGLYHFVRVVKHDSGFEVVSYNRLLHSSVICRLRLDKDSLIVVDGLLDNPGIQRVIDFLREYPA